MRAHEESPRPPRVKIILMDNHSIMSCSTSTPSPHNKKLSMLAIKVRYLLVEDDYKKFVEQFLDKPIDTE